METVSLLWWLVKKHQGSVSSPSHGETASAAHVWEAQISFRSWSRAQRAAAALQNLCGGTDLTVLARDSSLQGKGSC